MTPKPPLPPTQPRHPETVHQCPPVDGGGIMPCCGLTPFEVPRTDRITLDPSLVTCAGDSPVPAAGEGE